MLFVSPCVPERRKLYIVSTALIPSIFVSVLTSVTWEECKEVRLKAPPHCMLKNLKRGFGGD
jgi:hypothetical protein